MFGQQVALPTGISSQYHAQDEAGQYTFGYTNDISSKVQQSCFVVCVMRGNQFDASGAFQQSLGRDHYKETMHVNGKQQ